MAWWLGALAALPEVLGLVSSNHMVIHKHLDLQFQTFRESDAIFWPPQALQAHGYTSIHIKQKYIKCQKKENNLQFAVFPPKLFLAIRVDRGFLLYCFVFSEVKLLNHK